MQVTYKEELAPVSFIAGDYQEFEYNFIDIITGKTINLGSDDVEVKMALFRYGDSESPVMVIQGEKTGGSKFVVKLKSEYTKDLNSGLYIHQPIIIDADKDVFRPCQGTINILARAKEEQAATIYDL